MSRCSSLRGLRSNDTVDSGDFRDCWCVCISLGLCCSSVDDHCVISRLVCAAVYSQTDREKDTCSMSPECNVRSAE